MIYVLAGSPGSGKTVIADHFADAQKIHHLSFRKLVHAKMSEVVAEKNTKDRDDWINFRPFDPSSAFKILKKEIDVLADNFILEGYPKSAEEAIILVDYLLKKKKEVTLLSTAFPTVYKGMVILNPIIVYSLCSHHLLSVEYEVLFGYIPKNLSLGFSKIVKAIKLIAAKPTLQEDFTQEIIDTFQKILDPKGVMVVVKGRHSCMAIRSEKSANVNITSALRGEFKTSTKTREEFLSLSKFSNNQ